MGSVFDKMMRAHATASVSEHIKKAIELGDERHAGKDVSAKEKALLADVDKQFEPGGDHYGLVQGMAQDLRDRGYPESVVQEKLSKIVARDKRSAIRKIKRALGEGSAVKGTDKAFGGDNYHAYSTTLPSITNLKLMGDKFSTVKGDTALGKQLLKIIAPKVKKYGIVQSGKTLTLTDVNRYASGVTERLIAKRKSDRRDRNTGKPIKQRGMLSKDFTKQDARDVQGYNFLKSVKLRVTKPQKAGDYADRASMIADKGQHNKKSK